MESDGEFIMAVKYLSGNRLWGTNAERLAMTVGGSAYFDGNDYVDVGGSATDFNFLTTTFSLACWMKLTPLQDAIIFDNCDANASSVGVAFVLEHTGGGNYQITAKLNRGTGVGYDVVTSAVWGDTDWQHIVVTYDGTTMKLYRNDTEVGSGSLTSSSSDQSYVPRIGWCANGNKNEIDGYIDDFLLTDDVLTGAEITALAGGASVDSVTSITEARQELHYTFDTNFNDSSGNGYNGTATGATISTSVFKTAIYPNLPNGSVFITSDTNVHYMWNGTDTWNEVA